MSKVSSFERYVESHLRRRIHEIKLEQVLHTQALEQENRVGQVGTLDFRDRALKELVPKGHLRVQSVTESLEL